MSYSYATKRKIRIIKEALGDDWEEQTAGESISMVYNRVTGDTRKNLFCKIKSETKARLDEMVDFHKTEMAEFVEQLCDAEWSRYQSRQSDAQKALLDEFSG